MRNLLFLALKILKMRKNFLKPKIPFLTLQIYIFIFQRYQNATSQKVKICSHKIGFVIFLVCLNMNRCICLEGRLFFGSGLIDKSTYLVNITTDVRSALAALPPPPTLACLYTATAAGSFEFSKQKTLM